MLGSVAKRRKVNELKYHNRLSVCYCWQPNKFNRSLHISRSLSLPLCCLIFVLFIQFYLSVVFVASARAKAKSAKNRVQPPGKQKKPHAIPGRLLTTRSSLKKVKTSENVCVDCKKVIFLRLLICAQNYKSINKNKKR